LPRRDGGDRFLVNVRGGSVVVGRQQRLRGRGRGGLHARVCVKHGPLKTAPNAGHGQAVLLLQLLHGTARGGGEHAVCGDRRAGMRQSNVYV
jgi:hypothetical protein